MVESFLCESWIMTTSSYFFLFLEISLPLSPATWPRPDAAAAGGVTPPRLMRRRAPAGGIHFDNYVFKGFVCSYVSEKTGFPKTIPFVLPKIKVLLPKWPYGTWDHFMVSSKKRSGHCILQSKLTCLGVHPLVKLPYGWIISLWIMNNDYFFLFLLIPN